MSTNTNTVVTVGSLKVGDKFRHQRLISTVTTTARNGVWFTTSKGKGRIAPKTEVALVERAKGVSKTAAKKTAAKPAAKKATTPKTTAAKKTAAAPKKTAAKAPAKKVATPAKKAAAKKAAAPKSDKYNTPVETPVKKATAKPNTPRKSKREVAPVAKKTAPVRGARRRPIKKATKVGLPQNAVKALSTTPDGVEFEEKRTNIVVWPVWEDKVLSNNYGTAYMVKTQDEADKVADAMESGTFWEAVYAMNTPKGVVQIKCIGGEASFRKALGRK